MAAQPKAAREPGVTELLADDIAHLLMRADHVEARDVSALVARLHADWAQRPDDTGNQEVRS